MPNTAEPAKPRRRWFQFRLRTLLAGIVLLAVPCAIYARHVHESEEAERIDRETSRAVKLDLLSKVGSYLREGTYDGTADEPTTETRQ